jgi:fatty-acyl-CoA synthase
MIQSTMQDFPLNVGMIFRHGKALHGDSQVVTFEGDHSRRALFAEVAVRAEQLAVALRDLGVAPGDVVGTFMWNIFEDQLAYIVNHAADRVIIVGHDLAPLLAHVAGRLESVERYVIVGDGDVTALEDAARDGVEFHRYDDLLAAADPGAFDFPEIDEWAPAAMCYTSGTTGNPKGVVYSHRSTFMHTLGVGVGVGVPYTWNDRVLPIVPMFHAMAWGAPYGAWMAGADVLMPNRYLQAEPMARFIAEERPTTTCAVPTIWSDLLRYSETHDVDVSSLERIMCGGAAVPRALMQAFEDKFGIRMLQAWGLTETSPVAAVSLPPRGVARGSEEEMDWREKTGRPLPGVELRIVGDDDQVLPWDGEAVGEIEARGSWITGSYYGDPAPEKFHDGWLRTGDIASITPNGYVKITDRAKDVIKSGGEWISSVELEGLLLAHPDVAEAAVIAVPDPRWDERPLACVVVREGVSIDPEDLRSFLAGHLAKWQLPERWAFIDEVPKTSVGKFDKKVLRARHADGELEVVEL